MEGLTIMVEALVFLGVHTSAYFELRQDDSYAYGHTWIADHPAC